MRAWGGLFLRADGSVRPGWKALLFLAAHGLAVGLVAWLGLVWLPGSLRLWIAAATTAGVSWLFLTGEGRSFRSLGWGGGGRWAGEFGAGCLLGSALMGAVASLLRVSGGFHWTVGSGGIVALVQGAWFFLAVAFREELLFRGYPFQRLVEAGGPWTALLLTSAGFAAAHWQNPGLDASTRTWAAVNLALAGLLLGLGYLRTRRLALPLGLHLGWNWTQGSLLGFPVSGLDSEGLLSAVPHGGPIWLTGGAFGPEASLPCAVVLALGITGLLVWKPAEAR